MTETEVVAVHGSATVESVTVADRRDGSRREVPVDGRVRDDRRRPLHGSDHGHASRRQRGVHPVRRRRRKLRRTPPLASRRTASRTCSRRPAPACSRRATCARAPPTAWPARSATERWSFGSYTTYWPADSHPRHTSSALREGLCCRRRARLGAVLDPGVPGGPVTRRRTLPAARGSATSPPAPA